MIRLEVMTQLHSALFIDYDNVRTELDRYDPAIAARFSNKPLLWLAALEESLQLPNGHGSETRRIVSRRCYASPHMIERYRRNFTQTGFEVIDCPPLTAHLKNSADIYIVMDIIDYIQRYPHIEEYIILSADADFVPVLNRLRKELKKSVIFTSYNTTSAYRNCADRTIEADFFAGHLAIESAAPRAAQESEPRGERVASPAPAATKKVAPELSAAIEACLVKAAGRRFGSLAFAAAAAALREDLAQELGQDWAGRRTFTMLLQDTELERLEVDWKSQLITDPQYRLELPGWEEDERERLQDFVLDVMVSAGAKAPPLLHPADYGLIFDELAAYYHRDEPGTFADCLKTVAEECGKNGLEMKAQDIRFIATGISMQQYRFAEGANAHHLAALWRVQVFDLCHEPDWMREPEEAELLAAWLHARGESIEEARDDFLVRTSDEPGVETTEPAAV
jgi:hypothetical protein